MGAEGFPVPYACRKCDRMCGDRGGFCPDESYGAGEGIRLFAITGVLGGFTTFFSFFTRFFPSGTIREYFSGGCLRHRKRCPGTLCHVCCI